MLVKGNRLRDFEDAPAKPSEGHWKKADHEGPFGKHEAPPSGKEGRCLTDDAEREEIQQSKQVVRSRPSWSAESNIAVLTLNPDRLLKNRPMAKSKYITARKLLENLPAIEFMPGSRAGRMTGSRFVRHSMFWEYVSLF
jgi:hypothetical protein